MSSNKITDSEPQEPKIRRKRGRHRQKKAVSFERNSFEPMLGRPKKPNLFEFTMNVLYKNLYLFGITLLRYRLRARRRLKKAGAKTAAALASFFARIGIAVRKRVHVFWTRLTSPFLRIRRTYREVKPEIMSKRARGEFPFAAYFTVLETIARLILKILTTIFNYLAPVAAAALLVTTVTQRVSEPKLYVLTYNSEVLGYIDNAAEFNEAARDVRSRVTIDGENAFEIFNPHFEFMRQSEFEKKQADGDIPPNVGKIEKDELADKLILASNADVEEAFGLYIDNQFLGAVLDKDPILDKFDEIKNSSRTGKPDEEVAFTRTVRLSSGLYPRASVTSGESIIEQISRNETSDEIYTVKSGDSPTLIADKTGVPYDVLKTLNPGIEEKLVEGMEIKTQVARPYMSVESTYTDIVEEEIPFETVKVENATYARGYTNTFQDGVNGLREVTYRVSAVDGFEIRRVEIGENILKHPVEERVTVGINNPTVIAPVAPSPPAQSSSGQQTAPARPQQPVAQTPTRAGFIRPVPAGVGYISCYLGGYPGHTGVDIAVTGGTGTPILASADGVVSRAVNSNMGYGRHIIIDHGNGYTTLYAHNSALYVSVGDRVRQGQVIAGMGRTGNATGIHVHFEVRYNGQIRNPVDFIGRY